MKRKKVLNNDEKEIWMRYHIPGMGNLNRVKINAIFISAANSYEHERAKFDVCYELNKKGHKFVTEAEESINKVKYRRDIVDLTTGDIIEVETDPKRAARFKDDPKVKDIIVKELWK